MIHSSQFTSLSQSRVEKDKDGKELIAMLRGIIYEQELKIAELETDLKRWEKKYKEEFFKDAKNHNCQYIQKLKENEELILTFSKDLEIIQSKHERKSMSSNSSHNQHTLKDGINLLQSLHLKVESLMHELSIKNQFIEEKQSQIVGLKNKLQNYLSEYEQVIRKSQEYEARLIGQIKRQKDVIEQYRN